MKNLELKSMELINAGGFASGYCGGFAGVVTVASLASLANPVVAAAVGAAVTTPVGFLFTFGSATFCAIYMANK